MTKEDRDIQRKLKVLRHAEKSGGEICRQWRVICSRCKPANMCSYRLSSRALSLRPCKWAKLRLLTMPQDLGRMITLIAQGQMEPER